LLTENGFESLMWFMGIVEDNDDPTNHGRVRVRAFGVHPPVNATDAFDRVDTQDLPWAFMINGTGGKFFSVPDNGDYVFGFFADGRDAQHPFVVGVIHGAHLGMSAYGNGASTQAGTRNQNPDSGEQRATNIEPLPGNTNMNDARSQAEAYLGREMSDAEWDALVRATFAEASPNPRERAAVMGVILNRVNSPLYPDDVIGVLNQRGQFQAVTGTRYEPGPSSNYTATRSQDQLNSMAGAVNEYLPTVNTDWLNFTADNTAAYGRGTNIGFRETVRNADGSEVIGGTVFGTVR
jgi:hypothetical protein